jgi:hypothetical protein
MFGLWQYVILLVLLPSVLAGRKHAREKARMAKKFTSELCSAAHSWNHSMSFAGPAVLAF